MRRKILIIGGTRFLGPSIINLLLKNGDKVFCFNRGNKYTYQIPKSVKQIKGDRENARDLKQLENYSFDLVYDMCCYYPRQAEKLINAIHKNSKHIIFLSTAAVYKKTYLYPLKEDAEKGKWSSFGDYGTNKSQAEEKFIRNAKRNNTKLTIFRPVYILGKDNYFDRENYYFSRVLGGQKILVPGNGNALIQCCFVDETADMFYKIPLLQTNQIETLNLGGDEYITVKGFAELCASIAKKQSKIHLLDTKEYGFEEEQFRDDLYPFPNVSLILSNARIKERYDIQFKDLNEGLKDIYKHWIKKWDGNVRRSEKEKNILKEISI